MENKDIKFMKLALKEAQKAYEEDEVPVGAVIVIDNKVVAKAHNIREQKQIISGHAEMVAIAKINKKFHSWRFPEAEIYVTIEPCIMCAGAIIQSRFKRIIYGSPDYSGGALGTAIDVLSASNINHHPEVISGVMQKECEELMKKYFKEKRKQRLSVK